MEFVCSDRLKFVLAKMYFEFCTPEQVESIYSELGTTKDAVEKDVRYLIDWMEKQPHLPDVRGEYSFLEFKYMVYCVTKGCKMNYLGCVWKIDARVHASWTHYFL